MQKIIMTYHELQYKIGQIRFIIPQNYFISFTLSNKFDNFLIENQESLSKEVLAEIPDQLLGYMRSKGWGCNIRQPPTQLHNIRQPSYNSRTRQPSNGMGQTYTYK